MTIKQVLEVLKKKLQKEGVFILKIKSHFYKSSKEKKRNIKKFKKLINLKARLKQIK